MPMYICNITLYIISVKVTRMTNNKVIICVFLLELQGLFLANWAFCFVFS